MCESDFAEYLVVSPKVVFYTQFTSTITLIKAIPKL